MTYFLSGFPAGTIASTISPFFLPPSLSHPQSSLDLSPGGDPTRWVRKRLCGCVECGTCPTYRDLELTAIAMRWVNLLPGLGAAAEVFCSLGGQLWVSPTLQE